MEHAFVKTRELGLVGKIRDFEQHKDALMFMDIPEAGTVVNISHISEDLIEFIGEVVIVPLGEHGGKKKTGFLKILESEETEIYFDLNKYTYIKNGEGLMTFPNLISIAGIWKIDKLEGDTIVSYQPNGDWTFTVRCHNGLMDDQARGYKQTVTADGMCLIEYPGGPKWEGGFYEILEHGSGVKVFLNNKCYEGEVQFGRYHGKGKYVWANGDVYEGEWLRGERHGFGAKVNVDGSSYQGKWKHGTMKGDGIYQDQFQSYEGKFLKGKAHGRGKLTYSSGDYYEGDFTYGKKNGKGIFVTANGEKFDGRFQDNYLQGQAVYISPTGEKYDGDFEKGLRHGSGKLQLEDGSSYEGTFHGNVMHGEGSIEYSNGDKYTGTWQEGFPHGAGLYNYANGGFYEGEFQFGKPQGVGQYTYPNGDVYQGGFYEGFKHGQGTMTYADDGRKLTINFEADLPIGEGVIVTQDGETKMVLFENGSMQ